MPTYLDRYLAGEHEQVWADLVTLGPAVRDEPVSTDARAVAHETMRRARHNIETLIPRLREIGYQFGYAWLQPGEEQHACGQPPVFDLPTPDCEAHLAELERLAGPVPLSLHAFYEQIGVVNFVGAALGHWNLEGPIGDPMYVYPTGVAIEEHEDWAGSRTLHSRHGSLDGYPPFCWPIAPDALHKYNISGGMWYHVALPCAAADAPLEAEWHHTTFVNYLRICFRWGGFPGWERVEPRPDSDLAFLTEGLLPI